MTTTTTTTMTIRNQYVSSDFENCLSSISISRSGITIMNNFGFGVCELKFFSRYPTRHSKLCNHYDSWQLHQEKYSKGAEIYPVTNSNTSFTLNDSFPNGLIPEVVHEECLDYIQTRSRNVKRRELNNDDIQQLLPLVTSAEKEEVKKKKNPTILVTKRAIVHPISTPILVALSALITGYVPPSYLLLTIFLSGYLVVLGVLASSSFSFGKQDAIMDSLLLSRLRPVLSSVPPQGHVPVMVANPLGPLVSKSLFYQRWLLCGVVCGYIFPVVTVAMPYIRGCDLSLHVSYLRHVVTSIFLLSIQMATEAIGKQLLLPLPLRIFIPVSYNSIRMVPLYQWIMVGWKGMVLWERVLSLVNFLYWGANLFGFLIPVASMKYFKSHFLAVEAQEVVLRDRHWDYVS